MKKIKSKIEVLSMEEMNMIHRATLDILENKGIVTPHDGVLKLCEENGGVADYDKKILKIPAKTITELIEKNRVKNSDRFEHVLKHQGMGISTQIFINDYKTKTRRYGLLDDVMKGLKLLDEINNLYGTSSVVIPSDVPDNETDVVSFHKIFSYAKKEGGTYILSETGAKYIIEMSKIMGRGYGYLLETVSPLSFRKESLDIAMVYVSQGGGLGIGPMVMGGSTGPVTIAGTMTLANCEILASLFVVYALTGELGDYYANYCHSMDLKTAICSFGSPNQSLYAIASAQMGEYYGMWSGGNTGLSDSLMPDFQAGFEKASNMLFGFLSGGAGCGAMGIAGADQGISLEQIVLDNEMFNIYNYITDGFEVTEETIAADIIKEVGHMGHYLDHEHTIVNMRENYYESKLFDRVPFGHQSRGELLDIAHDYVESVTKGYKDMTPVIDSKKFEELNVILHEAQRELALERK